MAALDKTVEHIVTHGTFELDGGSWEVDNNIWLVGDDSDVVVFDAAHSAEPIVAAVEFEGAMRNDALDGGHYSITTERSTLPSCILWNASSMPSRPMRSETNFSSGNRPCR